MRRPLPQIVFFLLLSTALPLLAQPSPLQGPRPLDAVEGVDLEGQEWNAENLLGKVVLLDFWATWCAPCLAEIPRLRSVDERYAKAGLVVLGVSLDEMSSRQLRGWLRRQEIHWPQIHDRRGFDGELARRFAVDAIPSNFLFDREGRMIGKDLSGERLQAVLDSLFRAHRPSLAAASTK